MNGNAPDDHPESAPDGQAGGSAGEVAVTKPQPDTTESAPWAEPLPASAPASQRAEVARWVVTFSEPLIATAERRRVDLEMARFVERNSDWACAYLAGVLTDIAHTLPPDDPWRALSALIDLDQVSTGRATTDPEKRLARRSETAPLPGLTGAFTAEGRPFGTRTDAADLLTPGVPDSSTDVGMAAVATNLSPLGAALVGFSFMDAKTLQYVLGQTYHHLWLANFAGIIEESAGQALVDSAGSALRWLIHRRRAYTSMEDTYPNIVGFAWIAKADRVAAGTPILDEGGLAGQGRIDPTLYRYLAGIDDGDDIEDGAADSSDDDF